MTESRERRIPYTELTVLSFHCAKCQAELLIDLGNTIQTGRFRANVKDTSCAPFLCSFCQEPFPPALRAAVDCFCDFRYYLKQADPKQVDPHLADFRLSEPQPAS
jgi:hypothetical protein